jgi:probable F420-dependent oxidoreductase
MAHATDGHDLPLGFGLPVSGTWATPGTMLAVARSAEEQGYAALWTFQRVLHPADGGPDPAWDERNNPAARSADDASYRMVQDPLLPLALAAGHTERIGLGTATVCAPFTAPALLAKQFVTLDRLSGGRVTAGVGMGWLPHEYEAAGVPYERRGARMDEHLRCFVACMSEDPVEFAGEFYRVPRSRTGLRPVQRPHPPVLVGGAAPAALRRAGRLAQGWISSTKQDLAGLPDAVALVREGAAEAGKDPGEVRILVRAVVDLVDADPGPGRRPFHGTRDQVLADLAGVVGRGATELFVDLNFHPAVGSPDVDGGEAAAYARLVLDALAPAPRP